MLTSISSRELAEWMAYFAMRAEGDTPPLQHAEGQAALDLMAKHAKKRRS